MPQLLTFLELVHACTCQCGTFLLAAELSYITRFHKRKSSSPQAPIITVEFLLCCSLFFYLVRLDSLSATHQYRRPTGNRQGFPRTPWAVIECAVVGLTATRCPRYLKEEAHPAYRYALPEPPRPLFPLHSLHGPSLVHRHGISAPATSRTHRFS
ncbi:hypothetical protein EDB84DRAFT_447400 [Lactarius hengduanensis]|nr:hypothetical protein EDB84DRAFT_447400 [Lactarius hengduanensis]